MKVTKAMIPVLLLSTFFIFGCVYIVLPEGLEESGNANAENFKLDRHRNECRRV